MNPASEKLFAEQKESGKVTLQAAADFLEQAGEGEYRLLDFLQMCIASADLISSSRKSGCAMPIRASERSQVDMPFRFTMPYSVTM